MLVWSMMMTFFRVKLPPECSSAGWTCQILYAVSFFVHFDVTLEPATEKRQLKSKLQFSVFLDLLTYFPIDLHLHWTCFAWLNRLPLFLLWPPDDESLWEILLSSLPQHKSCCISVSSVFHSNYVEEAQLAQDKFPLVCFPNIPSGRFFAARDFFLYLNFSFRSFFFFSSSFPAALD